MTIRILVVDDHPLYREGLVTALSATAGMQVVGEAADGLRGVAAASELAPDVVLMDLSMPEMNGIEATRAILADRPGTAVLVLSMIDGDDSIFAAMRAGARGYLLKGADRAELARAVQSVANGEAVFSADIASRVLTWFAAGNAHRAVTPFPSLTEREREVLDLLARGLTNAAIARRLVVSDKTVRNHVSNVFTKLHVADRAEAVARARDVGLGSGPI